MIGRALIAPFVSQKLTGVFAKISSGDLDVLGGLAASGKINPVLDQDFCLARDRCRHPLR